MSASPAKKAYTLTREALATHLSPDNISVNADTDGEGSVLNYEENITKLPRVPSIASEERWAINDGATGIKGVEEAAMSIDKYQCKDFSYHDDLTDDRFPKLIPQYR
jgi:hypothetical protein